MTTRAVEQFDEWESSPFRDGYRGLHDLADGDFSGIVTAGPAKLCLLNGTAVGVLDGEIEDFEGASGTAYEAPSPALPLLALMQERNDEVRAKYYSEDTPLAEVDGTLSDGGFTGFVELSENVLSGDYYIVYHRGRSMAVAWVGNSGQLLTDDEAFERADGEVGIFQVRPAEVESVEIPEAESDEDATDDAATGGAAAGGGDATGATTEESAAGSPDAADAAASDADDENTAASGRADAGSPESADAAGASAGADHAESDPADATAATDASESDAGSADATPASAPGSSRAAQSSEPEDRPRSDTGRTADAGASTTDETGEDAARTDAGRDERTDRRASDRESAARTGEGRSGRATDADRERTERRDERESPRSAGARSTEPDHDTARERAEPSSESSARTSEAGGRTDERPSPDPAPNAGAAGTGSAGSPDRLATHSVPSLDPSRTRSSRSDDGSATEPSVSAAAEERPGSAPARRTESADGRQGGRSTASDGAAGTGSADARRDRPNEEPPTADAGADASSARVRDLEAELAESEAEIGDLEADLAAAESERDDLRAQLEEVRAERDDLRSRIDALESERDELESEVERLESEVDEIEAEFGAAVEADRRLSPAEALDQTNLFVRYESKGKATLETAHAAEASRQEVGENLGLEYHTQFDRDSVSVGGRPFDEFLRETIQFRFVAWVINDLLYEVRDTGKVAQLQALYDAIPRIDRAELNGAVSTEYVEDGQERRGQESFDVVMRDRMGNALLTANMNDSRQAATESMMSSLVTASSHVGESTETLGASFLVTSSFFEPEALETAAEATSGGLLSRDKRESFVKLSRKQGYHLCLVEAREEKFHLAVPEL